MELTREALQEIKAKAERRALQGGASSIIQAYLSLAEAAYTLDIMIAEAELAEFAFKK